MSKVFLALLDGMRPDALPIANHPFYRELLETSAYSMKMRTVMPSVTLPCHMSLFHSVSTDRHGILSNTYVPQVRPVKGLCEVLRDVDKPAVFFYTWEQLRDLSRPGALLRSTFYSGGDYTYEVADKKITEDAERMLQAGEYPNLIFFYQCQVDEMGHKHGWMSDEYIRAINCSLTNVQRLVKQLPEDYKVIVTADHGGHNRSHGTDADEDMTIPVFMRHSSITPGELQGDLNIIDFAPTIAKWLDVAPDPDWEGKVIL